MVEAAVATVREREVRARRAPIVPVAVPKLWPGSTIVCIGTGPSLTGADVAYCRNRARVIVVNDAYRLADWADVLYACDGKWWYWHRQAKDLAAFEGLKYALDPKAHAYGAQVLRNTGDTGLDVRPDCVRNGRNSGYQAINLAVHLGAARILLLGYDMQGDHYFGHHPDQSRPPFGVCLKRFQTLVKPLRDLQVAVINCTRKTALTCFPCQPLEEALP